jgi:Na+/H+ antiporter NhaC
MHKKIYLSVILGILFFVSCKDKKQYYEESGTVFHTLYTIKYEAPHILTDKIDAELQKFNLSLNPFNPNSIITKGLSLNDRILQYSSGAANKNIMLMLWIFILAGAFAQSAKAMGAIDATVNLTLLLLPDNLLLAGIFLASCFISLSIGTSVGTIVALTPVAAGIAMKTDVSLPFMTALVIGGAFFGDNLSFISDTTIAATRTQGCVMRDKFRVNFLIAVPAALLVFIYYIIYGTQVESASEIHAIEWGKVIPYLIVLGTAIAGMKKIILVAL